MIRSIQTRQFLYIAATIAVTATVCWAQPPARRPTIDFPPRATPVGPAVLSPQSDTLITAERSGDILIRSTARPQARPQIVLRDRANPQLMAMSPDGSQVAVLTRQHGLEVAAVPAAGEPRVLERGEFRRLRSLHFTPDGRFLIGLTASNRVIRWSVRSGRIAATSELPAFAGPVAVSLDGKFAVGGIADRGLVTWNVGARSSLRPLQDGRGNVDAVAMSSSGRFVAAAMSAGSHPVRVWETTTGRLLQSTSGSRVEKTMLTFSADEKSLTVVDEAGLVTRWQVPSGRPLGRLQVAPGARASVAVSADSGRVAVPDPTSGAFRIERLEMPREETGPIAGRPELPNAPAEAAPVEGFPDAPQPALPPTINARPPVAARPGDAAESEEAAPSAPRDSFPPTAAPQLPQPGARSGSAADTAQPEGAPADEDGETEEDNQYKFVPVYYGTNRQYDPFILWAGHFAGFFFSWMAFVVYGLFVMVVVTTALVSGGRAARASALLVAVLLLVLGVTYATVKRSGWYDTLGDEYGARTTNDSAVEYGRCVVSIPPGHTPGQIESPPSFWIFRGKEDPRVHIMIQSLERYADPQEFARLLRADVEETDTKQVLLFIHGYNVPFREAVRRSAQLSVDLDFPGPALCFSWPSHGDPVRYVFDEANAEASVAPLRDFLRHVAATSGAERIHVIAHSMGNRVLGRALPKLSEDEQQHFRHIVLAAPDVDQRVFLGEFAPDLTSIGSTVTLYASSEDEALKASKRFHNFQRAGDTVPTLTLFENIETIDASGVDTSFLGHSYVGDAPTILNDLRQLLLEDVSAAERLAGTARRFDGRTYWTIQP